jgi:hypothetical protein
MFLLYYSFRLQYTCIWKNYQLLILALSIASVQQHISFSFHLVSAFGSCTACFKDDSNDDGSDCDRDDR